MRTAKLTEAEKKTNRLAIAISNAEKEKLEKISLKKDVSMSAIGRMAIREFIEKEGL